MKEKIKGIAKKLLKKSQEKHVPKNALQLSALGIIAGLLLSNLNEYQMFVYIGYVLLALCVLVVLAACFLGLLSSEQIKRLIKKYIDNRNAHKKLKNLIKLEEVRATTLKSKFSNHEIIRVGFYSDLPSLMTTYEMVYDKLKEDKKFEPIYLAYPEVDLGKFTNYDILEYFEEKNQQYVKMYDEETSTYVDLDSLNLDYIFFNRHYVSRRPACVKTEKLREKNVLCMIPYVASPAGGETLDTVCRFNEMTDFDVLFAENKEMLKTYEEYRAKAHAEKVHLEVVGSPKYDAIYYSDYETEKTEYKQVILYTPRWRTSEGTCSFFILKEYFFELVEENPDIKYIFRPHPLMAIEIGKKEMGMNMWQEFINTFDSYDNAEIDLSGDYRDVFKQATVLVSDISSMMIEFLITGKPVIYYCMRDMLSPFNEALASGYYFATSKDEVAKYLDELRNGVDYLAEERQRLIKDTMMLGDNPAAENIKTYILKDFDSRRNKKK